MITLVQSRESRLLIRDQRSVAACQSSIEVHSKSFAMASRLLAPGARLDARVIYAWCRRADDAVDLAESKACAKRKLGQLCSELEQIYAGAELTDPVLLAFQEVAFRCSIPKLYPHELLLGMQMDADGVRYLSQDELMLYCYRVAGTVGLMMCHVLGLSDSRGLKHAAHLGMAMQLTNICRDVAEDYEQGRVYLPYESLQRFGIALLFNGAGAVARADRATARTSGVSILPANGIAGLAQVIREQLRIADKYYASGDQGLYTLDRRSQFAVSSARLIYSRIGRQIEATGYDPCAGRAHVGRVRKLMLIAQSAKRLFCKPTHRPCGTLGELPYGKLEKL